MAGIDFAFHMAGDIVDAVQICDGGPAEFHHDACHFASTVTTCLRACHSDLGASKKTRGAVGATGKRPAGA